MAKVTIDLYDRATGLRVRGTTDAGATVVDRLELRLTSAGVLVGVDGDPLELTPNIEITPANTRYRVAVEQPSDDSDDDIIPIIVPVSETPVTLASCEDEAVDDLGTVTRVITTGQSAGQALTYDEDEDAYVPTDIATPADLTPLMPAVARRLWGDPRPGSTKTEVRFGDGRTINPIKGSWWSHQEQLGGGVMKLIEHELKLKGAEEIGTGFGIHTSDEHTVDLEAVKQAMRISAPSWATPKQRAAVRKYASSHANPVVIRYTVCVESAATIHELYEFSSIC
jgi:hypothetical protein